jgi:glycosyltransferase involved in cell wall biosynthesis
MKILFIDTYYPKVLVNFRKNNPELLRYSFQKYRDELLKICWGTSDFFSYNLEKLGYKTEDLIINDEILQKKWAKENNLKIKDNLIISRLQTLPYIYRFIGKPKWVQDIALAQIKKKNPDIIYIQDLSILNPDTLLKVKKYCKLLVGQIASPTPPNKYLKCFDLIITSFPHFVEKFKQLGIKSEYQKLAFDQRVLKRIGEQKRIYNVTFIGSFTPYHKKGTKILEEVASKIPIDVWGQGIEYLSPSSPLRRNYHGEVWGIDMYRILSQSKIVTNRHIGVSGQYANNMRLYEATGMGAMLITDYKKNLNTLFEVGKEVVEYTDSKDLINKIKYYLKNDEIRKEIAEKGQRKTLRDHNYQKRMKELVKLLNKYI